MIYMPWIGKLEILTLGLVLGLLFRDIKGRVLYPSLICLVLDLIITPLLVYVLHIGVSYYILYLPFLNVLAGFVFYISALYLAWEKPWVLVILVLLLAFFFGLVKWTWFSVIMFDIVLLVVHTIVRKTHN